MQASLFLQNLRGVYDQREKPKRFKTALRNLTQKLRHIDLHEALPPSPEDYPHWMDFAARHAQPLTDSHLHAHYFELSKSTLDQIAAIYEDLVAFVATGKMDVPTLEGFVTGYKKEGLVVRSKPVEHALWRAPKCPGEIPNYLQLLVKLDQPQATRRVFADPKDVVLVKRHGGRQTQFLLADDKIDLYPPQLCPTMVLSLWVYVDEADPSQKRVAFGTGYIGDNFPFEEGDIMGALLDNKRPMELRLAQMQRFLDTRHQSKKIYALLPYHALPSF